MGTEVREEKIWDYITADMLFLMEMGGTRYIAALIRGDTNELYVSRKDMQEEPKDQEPIYALRFSPSGEFLDGNEQEGKSYRKITRDNFGDFALKYADHIQCIAGKFPPDECEWIKDLFVLGGDKG
ncbi:MAG: hypothetical protein V3V26_00300, partial [Candidatus Aenigmarchaeota archaeon]